jgi:hypothetical protein
LIFPLLSGPKYLLFWTTQKGEDQELVQYHVYDIPSSEATFGHRWGLLEQAVRDAPKEMVHLVPTYQSADQDHYDALHGGCQHWPGWDFGAVDQRAIIT